jgi:hypothetical protein
LFLLDFIKIFSSEMSRQNEAKLGRQHVYKVLYSKNKNCHWRACLLTDWDTISNLYRELSIHAAYQVLFYFGKRLRREDFLQKSTNQKQVNLVARSQ